MGFIEFCNFTVKEGFNNFVFNSNNQEANDGFFYHLRFSNIEYHSDAKCLAMIGDGGVFEIPRVRSIEIIKRIKGFGVVFQITYKDNNRIKIIANHN